MTASGPKPQRYTQRATALILGCAVLLAAGWLAGLHFGHRPPPVYTQINWQRGTISNARFAPDRGHIVYSGQFENGPLSLHTESLQQLQPALADLPGAALFDARENEVLIATGSTRRSNYIVGTLQRVALTGGTPEVLAPQVLSAAFAPDGKQVAVARFVNGRCRLDFPIGHPLYTSTGYLDYVRISPDGKRIAFIEHPVNGDDRGYVAVLDWRAESPAARRVSTDFEALQGLAWTRDSKAVWYTGSLSGSQGYELDASGLSGRQRRLLSFPGAARLRDIDSAGRVLITMGRHMRRTDIVDAAGHDNPGIEMYDGADLTAVAPQGKGALFELFEGPVNNLYRVLYHATDGSPPRDLGPGARPTIAPDGATVAAILFQSPPSIVVYSLNGAPTRTYPLNDLATVISLRFFSATQLRLTAAAPQQGPRTYLLDLDTGKVEPEGPEQFTGAALSPDGNMLAGYLFDHLVVNDLTTGQTREVPGLGGFESAGGVEGIANGFGGGVQGWSRDGKQVWVTTKNGPAAEWIAVDIDSGRQTVVQRIDLKYAPGSEVGLTISPDGAAYAYEVMTNLDTLYLLDGVH